MAVRPYVLPGTRVTERVPDGDSLPRGGQEQSLSQGSWKAEIPTTSLEEEKQRYSHCSFSL